MKTISTSSAGVPASGTAAGARGFSGVRSFLVGEVSVAGGRLAAAGEGALCAGPPVRISMLVCAVIASADHGDHVITLVAKAETAKLCDKPPAVS